MHIYSDIELKNEVDFLQTFYPSTNDLHKELPSLFQIHTPYRILVLTYDPKSDMNNLKLSILSPDSSAYITLNKTDLDYYLNKHSHQHDFFEFVFTTEGELRQTIEDTPLIHNTGDVCILNMPIRHYIDLNSKERFQTVLLQIHPWFLHNLYQDLSLKMFQIENELIVSPLEHFLENNLKSKSTIEKCYLYLKPCFKTSAITNYSLHLLNEIAKETLSPKAGTSLTIKKLLSELLQMLCSTVYYHGTPSIIDNTNNDLLFRRITQILEESHGRATRSTLQHTLHYSGSYLNNITKKYTGLTISHYGMTFRMKEAVRLLLKTDQNISMIATNLGFSNRTHFYHIFNNLYGVTPAEFRKTYQSLNCKTV